MPDDSQLVDRLRAVADPNRLAILRLLPGNSCQCEVYNVSELAAEIGISQPSVSHHLRILRNAGLIRSRKIQRDVYYWIDPDAMDQTVSLVQGLVAEIRP